MIIGVSGKLQAGKDTVGAYLVKEYNFHRIASADALKRIAMNIFGWDGQKDEKGRKFLQDLGCTIRAYNEDYWIKLTLTEMQRQGVQYGYKDFVITDVRFKNEVKLLKEAGAIILRVEREGIPTSNHFSETELDNSLDFDRVILNQGTIEDLEEKLGTVISHLPLRVEQSKQ